MAALVEPGRLLTIAECVQLGEDDQYRWELQEGNLVVSPSPSPDHLLAAVALRDQLKAQLPPGLVVVPDVDIDLQLVPAEQPGSSRRPDLVVVERAAIERVRTERGLLRASEVRLVVEIVSRGSRPTNYVIKRGEYAAAGIGHYWIVDLTPPAVSLLACHQPGKFGYADHGPITHSYTTQSPYPLTIDLTTLLD